MTDAIPADLAALFDDTSDIDAVLSRLMAVYGRAVLFRPLSAVSCDWETNLSHCTHARLLPLARACVLAHCP